MGKEKTIKEQIEDAIEDVKNCMIENMEADRAEVHAKDRKRKAHYQLQQANSRLRALQEDIADSSLEFINIKEVKEAKI